MNLFEFSKRVFSKYLNAVFHLCGCMVFLAGVLVVIAIAPILIGLLFAELYLGQIFNYFTGGSSKIADQ